MQLTEIELETFSRQLLIKNWGLKQQLNLKLSNILLRSENEIAARYLIAAGIGTLTITNDNLYKNLLGYELHTKLVKYDSKTHSIQFDYIIEENNNDNHILSGLSTAARCLQQLSDRE